MQADEFIELLAGVRRVGPRQWTAHCPAHVDQVPSLRVGDGGDRVLITCRAGCALGDILLELGLDWRDIFTSHDYEPAPEPAPGNVYVGALRGAPAATVPEPTAPQALPSEEDLSKWAHQVGVIHARLLQRKGWSQATLQRFRIGWDGRRIIIPVRGPDGELLTVLRYRPGAGNERKISFPRGSGRHLYPAPERLRVADLWLVEGEPDAISAHELGLPAVAAPGVNIWRDLWAERLRGRNVTVCFDADEAGRQASRRRVEQLRAAGIDARAVDLAPARHDGYDLGDALCDAIRQRRREDLRGYLRRLAAEAWSVPA